MHFLPKEPFVIISANTESQYWRDAVLQSQNLKTRLMQLNIAFKVVSGCFEGKTEVSYYIPWIELDRAIALAKEFGQKTVSVVDHFRNAKLVYTNGDPAKDLGIFEIGEDDKNYTIDDGIKYVCTGA
ncbi:MAG: hypothetical protein ACFFG0_08165 [Candidatus Thorarchaeota archaeon]